MELELPWSVRRDFLSTQSSSLPCQEQDLLSDCWIRSSEGWAQGGSVPFKCVFPSCSGTFALTEESAEASGVCVLTEVQCSVCVGNRGCTQTQFMVTSCPCHGHPRSSARMQDGESGGSVFPHLGLGLTARLLWEFQHLYCCQNSRLLLGCNLSKHPQWPPPLHLSYTQSFRLPLHS